MELESRKQRSLLIGALIGAVLGAGTAYLLATPGDSEEDAEREPFSARELLSLTSAAAIFIRRLDNIRRRLQVSSGE